MDQQRIESLRNLTAGLADLQGRKIVAIALQMLEESRQENVALKQEISRLEIEKQGLEERVAVLSRMLFGPSAETIGLEGQAAPVSKDGEVIAASQGTGADEVAAPSGGKPDAAQEPGGDNLSTTDAEEKVRQAKELFKQARELMKAANKHEEVRKAQELQKKARRLMRQVQRAKKKKAKQARKALRVVVRRRVPKGMTCRQCQGPVKDEGLSYKAYETDIPAVYVIKVEYLLHRGKCACGTVSFTMPGPDRTLSDSTFSARFIGKVIVDKFSYHMPVHRQELYWEQQGYFIHRKILNDIILRGWHQVFKVVGNLIRDYAKKQLYRYCDETPFTLVVKKEDGTGKIRKTWYLWCLVTDQAVVFTATEKRNQKIAPEITGTGGTLITDGHNAYDKIEDTVHGGCLGGHLRRYFFRALLFDPNKAMPVLEMIQELYRLEDEADAAAMTTDQRKEHRQKYSRPIVERMFAYIESLNPPPKSSLGKGKTNTINQRKKLEVFLSDGNVRLDNNGPEGHIRDPKLGLKNFLFCQSVEGIEAAAGWYTIIASCELHGKDPYVYIPDVMKKITGGWPLSRIEELLPWNWQPPQGIRTEDGIVPGVTKTYREENLSINELIQKRNLQNLITFSTDIVGESAESKTKGLFSESYSAGTTKPTDNCPRPIPPIDSQANAPPS